MEDAMSRRNIMESDNDTNDTMADMTMTSTVNGEWSLSPLSSPPSQDLPFLVTHWLAHYGKSDTQNITSAEVVRVHRAAAELASAFSNLGAFGVAVHPPSRDAPHNSSMRHATYTDLTRRWTSVSPSHLNSIAQSSTAVTNASHRTALSRARPFSIIDAEYEKATSRRSENSVAFTDDGRRVGDQVLQDPEEENMSMPISILQHPVLVTQTDLSTTQIGNPLASMSIAAASAHAASVQNDYDRIQFSKGGVVGGQLGPGGATIPTERSMVLALGSDWERAGIFAAQASRRNLAVRAKVAEEACLLNMVHRSLEFQRRIKNKASTQLAALNSFGQEDCIASRPNQLQSIDLVSRSNEADRVIAQLERKTDELMKAHIQSKFDLRLAKSVADVLYREWISVVRQYRDPFVKISSTLPLFSFTSSVKPTSRLADVVGRQYCAGGGVVHRRLSRRPTAMSPSPKARAEVIKSILSSRMSHAATVNCHLFYPVYCLRFDRTGQYFVTGADDHLAKLFHLGAAISSLGRTKGGKLRCNYGANCRGAVLVCTLKGHSGVITDIDVSSDNALLATASEDGDVRIWGLKDGSPVCILRGHTGGANMVSWSVLTPFRVVTTGQDGLARMWDVRQAALKRYGAIVGNRLDYALPCINETSEGARTKGLTEVDIAESNGSQQDNHPSVDSTAHCDVALPPLPMPEHRSHGAEVLPIANTATVRSVSSRRAVALNRNNNSHHGGGIFVPPLPPGAEDGVGAIDVRLTRVDVLRNRQLNNADDPPAPGAFVPSDNIDEGVHLLAKLQHGDVIANDQMQGPGTRARRKAVKVICISRCPIGGHFATGSDDGLGRVWADEDDVHLDCLDRDLRDANNDFDGTSFTKLISPSTPTRSRKRSTSDIPKRRAVDIISSRSTLLGTLYGHLNSITDIQYSYAGDRLLTASQKDGVVRVWSWGVETAIVDGGIKFDNFKQILIRLTVPAQCSQFALAGLSTRRASSGRRRGGGSTNASAPVHDGTGVLCDVAHWTSDDSKIVTSQSCPLKATGAEIIQGSQIIYVWDSSTGQCLVGIPSAHTSPCPVLVSHPIDASILASAGADGNLNIWDLDSGKRIFTHSNALLYGPVDPPSDKGKNCGYLDGTFSPNGLYFILTDDTGRITILDTNQSEADAKEFAGISQDRSNGYLDTFSNLSRLSSVGDLSTQSFGTPDWMKEQYFGNDYYDLIYDTNGYCIERGSEQPPHLAPKAVRCNHAGLPCSDNVNEAFYCISGPAPLSERETRLHRDTIRLRSVDIRKVGGVLAQNVSGKRAVVNAQNLGSLNEGDNMASSVLTNTNPQIGNGYFVSGGLPRESVITPNVTENTSRTTTRALSSRYRWSDYDDVLREEEYNGDDDNDIDDEEYEEGPVLDSSTNFDDDDLEVDEWDSPWPSQTEYTGRRLDRGQQSRAAVSRSQRRDRRVQTRHRNSEFQETIRNQPSRVSARQITRRSIRHRCEEQESSGDDLDQFLSTNRTPNGEFKDDYSVLGHFFRMPRNGPLRRKWVTRMESSTGMSGSKTYCPQVGDSVVYISRAHYDTLDRFPTGHNASAPWKLWPISSAWPVVRCLVKDIRYRFPYENYYRNSTGSQIISIVCILTLEITGIPEIYVDGIMPWPKPEFISRQTRSSSVTFELSVFESECVDFVIPEHLYTWRICCLEEQIRQNDGNHEGIEVVSYFSPTGDDPNAQVEDAEFNPYPSTIMARNPDEENEFHFQCSGYNCFEVKWHSNGEDEPACAWELTLADRVNDVPSPLHLSEEQKVSLSKILVELESDVYVKEVFSDPVDTIRFSDYLSMIEVPMCLSVIKDRLAGNYYSNILSVAADMKLICINCIKYNQADSDIALNAIALYDKFEDLFEGVKTVVSSAVVNKHHQDSRSRQISDVYTGTSSRIQSRSANRRIFVVPSSSVPENLPMTGGDDTPKTNTVARRTSNTRQTRSTTQKERLITTTEKSTEATSHTCPSTPEVSHYSSEAHDSEDAVDEDESEVEDDESSSDEEACNTETNRGGARTCHSAKETRALRSARVTRSCFNAFKEGALASCGTVDSEADHGSAHDDDVVESDDSRVRDTTNKTYGASVRLTRSSARKQSCDSDAYESLSSIDNESSESEVYEKVTSAKRRTVKTASSFSRSSLSARTAKVKDGSNFNEAMSKSTARGRSVAKYESQSDDEVSIEVSNQEAGAASDSGDDFVPSAEVKRKASSKRQAAISPSNKQRRSKRICFEEVQIKPKGEMCLPMIPRWPNRVVSPNKRSDLIRSIMKVMEQMDIKKLFRFPVAEQYPQVADKYLQVVRRPMDFRTIFRKIDKYSDIAELQDDLILTFRNCCLFNGEKHQFYFYAINMWQSLNDVFQKVCTDAGIALPRRWVKSFE